MKININKLHPGILWYKMISRGRNHALLIIDSVGWGNFKNYAKKIYNFDYQVKYYRQFNGSRWISKKDHKTLNRLYALKIKSDPLFLYKAGVKMEKLAKLIIASVNRYRNKDWGRVSDKKLIKIFEKFHDLESRLWGGPWFYGWHFFFNGIYLKNLRDYLFRKVKNDFDKLWNYLITPEKISFIGKEKLELLKLAKEYARKGKISKKKIEAHLKKFAFVNKYYFWGEGFTFKEIKKRIKDLAKKGEEKIVKEIKSFKPAAFNLKKYSLPKEIKEVIKGFRKMAYSIDFADEATNYYTYHLKSLFNEMAQRLKISYTELVSMRFEEIQLSFKKHSLVVSRQELQQRYKDHALIFAKDKVYILSGQELKKYRKKELKKEKIKEVKGLKGTVAFKGGKVKGTVHIIDTNEKVKLFKKGEVLVTQMTNPTFIPAMEKAVAIITDEGGLLCHAAIVSRELKVPCVIGTKIATKVLKNGDLIEVDANVGVIKILSKRSRNRKS